MSASNSIPSRRGANAVAQPGDANHLGAMLAAEEGAILLQPMPDDADAAILACRCQRVDGAFEAVERVGSTVHAHLKGLVVIVSAAFTSGHDDLASLALSRDDNPQTVMAVPAACAVGSPDDLHEGELEPAAMRNVKLLQTWSMSEWIGIVSKEIGSKSKAR
jgi:hypothetical protein